MKSKFNTLIKQTKKKWKLSLFIVVLVLLGIFWYYQRTQAATVELNTKTPTKQTISKTLNVSGHVDAKEKVRLRFIAGGKLTYVGAEAGDYVKKWQTIAVIDRATLQKQLEKDLNNYLKERWDWEELQDENKDQVLTTSEQRSEDKDQWDLDNTVLDVEIRDIAIQNTALYSPIEGILTAAPTSVAGMQVLSTDYFEIVNPNTLVFRAAVDESDVGLVSLGQKATLVLDSFTDQEIQTEVSYISYTSTETSGGTAFVVEFPLSQSDLAQMLRLGMNGDVDILIQQKDDVLTVPFIAVIERDGQTYVNVKTGESETEEREVELGLETDELVEVLSGLSESDEVVIPE